MIKSHVLYRLSYRITSRGTAVDAGADAGRTIGGDIPPVNHGVELGAQKMPVNPRANRLLRPRCAGASLLERLHLLAVVAVAGFQGEALDQMGGHARADEAADVAAQAPDLLHETR